MKPHPRIRKAVRWSSAAATLLLLATWLASGWWYLQWTSPRGYWGSVSRGKIGLGYVRDFERPGWHAGAAGFATGLRWPQFVWWTQGGWTSSAGGGAWGYGMPMWVVAAPVFVATFVVWRPVLVAHRRRRHGKCPACGYHRAGLTPDAVCPECGTPPGEKLPGAKFPDLMKLVKDDGWQHVRTTGSHLHFKHPTKPGVVTIPAGGQEGRDVAPGTLRSVLRQAGLLQ